MKYLIALISLLLSSIVWAAPSPFHPAVYARFVADEALIAAQDAKNTTQQAKNTTQDANNVLQEARNTAQQAKNTTQDANNVLQQGRNALTDANTAALTAQTARIADFTAASPLVDGINAERTVRATFDYAVDGNTIAAFDLGENLPAKAIITDVNIYVVTQLVDAGSGTFALSCEDANNLFNAADITGSAPGAVIKGISTYAVPVVGIGAACDITVTLAGATISAGKVDIFIKYLVHD